MRMKSTHAGVVIDQQIGEFDPRIVAEIPFELRVVLHPTESGKPAYQVEYCAGADALKNLRWEPAINIAPEQLAKIVALMSDAHSNLMKGGK